MEIEKYLMSDDIEIVALGAKLLLEKDEIKATGIKSKYWIDVYKDKKGQFHILRMLLSKNKYGFIHILTENEILNIIIFKKYQELFSDLAVFELIKKENEHS